MRPCASAVRAIVALVAVSCLAGVTSPAAGEHPPSSSASVHPHAGAPLPTLRERHYRMSGRIRPLLLWIGRDDIGTGRIAWHSGENGRRGYDLTIGTEPARAPRGLNRWGFVSEQSGPADGDLLALMFGTAVASLAEADRDAAVAGSGIRVRGMRGRLEAGMARGEVVQVVLDAAPTVHDLDVVLARLAYAPATSAPVSSRAAPDTRPGLLTAVADALDTLMTRARAGAVRLDGGYVPVPYTFGRHAYELDVRKARVTTSSWRGTTVRCVDADFEIRTLATGARTRFELTSGLDGELAGVPLEIRWQPRWWLEIGLHLQQ